MKTLLLSLLCIVYATTAIAQPTPPKPKETLSIKAKKKLKGLVSVEDYRGSTPVGDGKQKPFAIDEAGNALTDAQIQDYSRMDNFDFLVTPYVNSQGEIKALVAHKNTPAEIAEAKKQMGDMAAQMKAQFRTNLSDTAKEKLKGLIIISEYRGSSQPMMDTEKPFGIDEAGTMLTEEQIQDYSRDDNFEFSMLPYVNGDGKIKALLARKNTPEEIVSLKKQQEEMQKPALLNQQAPSFYAKDLKGNFVSADALKGKVVVVNFWFIGCRPCREEMPELNKLVEKYKDKNIEFLGFATDSETALNNFLQKNSFGYRVFPKASDVASSYKVKGFPTNYVINREGKVVFEFTGLAPGSVEQLDHAIEKALAN